MNDLLNSLSKYAYAYFEIHGEFPKVIPVPKSRVAEHRSYCLFDAITVIRPKTISLADFLDNPLELPLPVAERVTIPIVLYDNDLNQHLY